MLQGPQPPASSDAARLSIARSAAAAAPSRSFALPPGSGIPPTPPPEVLQALDRVQQVAQRLQAQGLTLRFGLAGERQVRAQVVDAHGVVVREIPVVQALDLLSGHDAGAEALLQ